VKRRTFIAALSCAAAWPAVTRAQTPGHPAQIGILTPAATDTTAIFRAFKEGLRELGYVDGNNVKLEFRFANGDFTLLPALARELVHRPVDVMVTDSTGALQAAFEATRTIPIVAGAFAGDLVAMGMAASLNRPGGNVTGFSLRTMDLSAKRVELLKRAFPAAVRVVVLANPANNAVPSNLQQTEDAARRLGLQPTVIRVGNPAELRTLTASTLVGADAVIVVNDAMFWNNRAAIIQYFTGARARGVSGTRIRGRWRSSCLWAERSEQFPACRGLH
jgi:putative ABC transport system substrate-binding protein